jgi:LemA protein
MMNVSIPTIIALTAAVALVLWIVVVFNRFVILRNRCRNQWAQIDILLERRHELIPKLVDAVGGYAAHERGLLERLTAARGAAASAGGVLERGAAELLLEGVLGRIFAVVENYPDLKANESFLALHRELIESEEKIRFARQFYNDTVMRYNTALSVFPNLVPARIFGFREEEFFARDAG